ncbi:MAG: hypothetical protein NTX25_12710 [Proteobacteria bacterium]|nr:hypothetical protein [Pseudomonadota bacterium]
MINPIFSGLLLLIGTAQIVVAADKARPAPFKSSATQSAQETGAVDIESAPPRSTPAPPAKIGNPKQMRLFHEVLNDILTEFAYDVKAKNLDVVKNIAIRKITLNEALPKSYENYLELMIIERLRSQAKMKLISCLPCKTKSTRVVEDRLFITSPTSNLEEMARASDELGIDNFMDVLFIYNSSHIVMAVQVFNSKSKEIIWAETYNSETLRSRYQKLAIDYNQIQQSRISDEYRPDFRYLIGLGAGNIPNVSKSALEKNMLSLHLRATEKFANRHNEFGLLLTLNLSSSSFLSTYPAEGTRCRGGFNTFL